MTQILSGNVREAVWLRAPFLSFAMFCSLVTNFWPLTVIPILAGQSCSFVRVLVKCLSTTMCQWTTSRWHFRCGIMERLQWSASTGKVRLECSRCFSSILQLCWRSLSSNLSRNGLCGSFLESFVSGVRYTFRLAVITTSWQHHGLIDWLIDCTVVLTKLGFRLMSINVQYFHGI